MSDADKANAYKVLGLAPGADKSQIDSAYNKLVAFSNIDSGSNGSIKSLADSMRADIEAAYKIVSQDSQQSSGTVSGGTQNQTAPAPAGKGKVWPWAIGALVVCGVLYQFNKGPDHPPPTPSPVPGPGEDTPTPTPIEPSSPQQPPDFIVPFIHQDDVKGRAVKWTSGWQNVDGAQRMVVWAYADEAMRQPVYKFEMYQDLGKWREWRHYIVRYSADNLKVSVQRYTEKGGSALEMKDQRNVSDKGDVLIQTTFYTFNSFGKLDFVRVDTPFMENKDGLIVHRESGSISAERVPQGGQISLAANAKWLNNLFDLWSVYGEPNL